MLYLFILNHCSHTLSTTVCILVEAVEVLRICTNNSFVDIPRETKTDDVLNFPLREKRRERGQFCHLCVTDWIWYPLLWFYKHTHTLVLVKTSLLSPSSTHWYTHWHAHSPGTAGGDERSCEQRLAASDGMHETHTHTANSVYTVDKCLTAPPACVGLLYCRVIGRLKHRHLLFCIHKHWILEIIWEMFLSLKCWNMMCITLKAKVELSDSASLENTFLASVCIRPQRS